jgi:hypothetical protein
MLPEEGPKKVQLSILKGINSMGEDQKKGGLTPSGCPHKGARRGSPLFSRHMVFSGRRFCQPRAVYEKPSPFHRRADFAGSE